jgi:hypothetical protein
MQVLRALREGILSTGVHRRAVGILYCANLLVSMLLILPLAFLLDRSIGHSAVGEGLAFRFDLFFLVDFLDANAPALDTYWIAIGYGAVAYLLLSSFLSGGVIDSLSSPGRSAYFSRFFGGCGKFFFRFLRLIPFALASLGALIWLNERLNRVLDRFFHGTTTEREAFWAMRAKQALLLVLLMLLGAVLDTARIQAALLGSTRMTARFFSAAFFVLTRLRRVTLLYLLMTLLGLACFLPYLAATRWLLPAGSVVLLFLAQQAMVYVRMWWRVCTVASQMSLIQAGGEPPGTAAFASAPGRLRRGAAS